MVANLAKLADRSFIVGFLFPALVFYSCALLLIVEPVNPALYTTLTESVTLGDVLYNALLVWTLAIFLMLGNDPLYKLLEGYWPPLSRISFRALSSPSKRTTAGGLALRVFSAWTK